MAKRDREDRKNKERRDVRRSAVRYSRRHRGGELDALSTASATASSSSAGYYTSSSGSSTSSSPSPSPSPISREGKLKIVGNILRDASLDEFKVYIKSLSFKNDVKALNKEELTQLVRQHKGTKKQLLREKVYKVTGYLVRTKITFDIEEASSSMSCMIGFAEIVANCAEMRKRKIPAYLESDAVKPSILRSRYFQQRLLCEIEKLRIKNSKRASCMEDVVLDIIAEDFISKTLRLTDKKMQRYFQTSSFETLLFLSPKMMDLIINKLLKAIKDCNRSSDEGVSTRERYEYLYSNFYNEAVICIRERQCKLVIQILLNGDNTAFRKVMNSFNVRELLYDSPVFVARRIEDAFITAITEEKNKHEAKKLTKRKEIVVAHLPNILASECVELVINGTKEHATRLVRPLAWEAETVDIESAARFWKLLEERYQTQKRNKKILEEDPSFSKPGFFVEAYDSNLKEKRRSIKSMWKEQGVWKDIKAYKQEALPSFDEPSYSSQSSVSSPGSGSYSYQSSVSSSGSSSYSYYSYS